MDPTANQRYHDRVAARYDDVYDGDPYHDFCREIQLRHLRQFLPRDAGARVLDAGCGTGWFGLRLAKSGYRVDFLDLSRNMLDRARANYAAAGLGGDPAFVHADLERPEGLERSAYALVVAEGDIFSFVDNPVRAARAVRELLRPDGALVASFDQRFAGLEFYLDKGDVDALARFVRDGRSEWLGGHGDERFPTRMFSPAEVRDVLERGGFEVASLIGRTVLPLRKRKALLEDRALRRRLLELEEKLNRVEAALGLATHLEAGARVRSGPGSGAA